MIDSPMPASEYEAHRARFERPVTDDGRPDETAYDKADPATMTKTQLMHAILYEGHDDGSAPDVLDADELWNRKARVEYGRRFGFDSDVRPPTSSVLGRKSASQLSR